MLLENYFTTNLQGVVPFCNLAARYGELPHAVSAKGEMAEWSKARAWKARILVKGYRGFESLSLRHRNSGSKQHGWIHHDGIKGDHLRGSRLPFRTEP